MLHLVPFFTNSQTLVTLVLSDSQTSILTCENRKKTKFSTFCLLDVQINNIYIYIYIYILTFEIENI
jgi:hypothetical protein